MSYKVIRHFTDLQDSNFKYTEGMIYPREGYIPSEKRINELASDSNKQHTPLIEAIPEVEATAPAENVTVEEEPKKRSRKKATSEE